MKWPQTSADLLLSEKTFLVIREDLHRTAVDADGKKSGTSHPSRGSSSPRDRSSSSTTAAEQCSCDTWPKMRKKRPRKTSAAMYDQSSPDEEPRPATACLEAPLVLDPRLVDKLDMSLLSKEHLSASLSRINLGVAKVVSVLDTSKLSKQRRATTTTKPRALFAGSRKPSVDTSSESETTRTSEASSNSPEAAKRLDDNNNKNKLSPLRSRSSKSTVSSIDVALFTSPNIPHRNPKKKPEACTTCRRSAQPERFHSHPKSPCVSPAKDSLTSLVSSLASARSSPSVIPIRAGKSSSRRTSAIQSPPMISPRSEQLVDSLASSDRAIHVLRTVTPEEKSSSDENSRKERKVSSATKTLEDKMLAGKRRPRSVTCYICGREFGTASFPIHEPKCLQKWHRENKTLPNSQRRNEPQRPNVPIDHEDWNSAAWEQSQALLIPCLKCKRTFLPDRLAIHERNCRVPNKVFH
ncbi:hypothetical protein TSAR_007374 [Trichomalopsis sarcophagae]|uniref:C2HC/C3H-type domain-containing protein n=1 Tax=Trichomalopsis sarcophagae TaxID=543379 RepID=A0A232F0L4_9HYME|nr:hypothetical protein TSAR_007374 [Trichomalopsis sarcophagae]